MNWELHLNTVFATPQLAEDFMKEIMKQLNDITFNGESKIDRVTSSAQSALVRVPKFKKCEQAHYYFSPRKAGLATIDSSTK